MMRSISTGKLVWFPLSTPVPEAAAQNWNLRILETTIWKMRSTICETNTTRCWRRADHSRR
jgi:hypothetical protein